MIFLDNSPKTQTINTTNINIHKSITLCSTLTHVIDTPADAVKALLAERDHFAGMFTEYRDLWLDHKKVDNRLKKDKNSV